MDVVALTAAHVRVYRALMLEAYAQAPDAFTSTQEERAAEPESWWLKRIADPGGTTIAFGAFHEGDLVGSVALEFEAKPRTKHKALLIGMYVKPSARGKGVGRQLLQAAARHVQRRQGISVVQLAATQGNEAAIRLYREAGFVEFGIEPMAIRTAAGYKARVHMWWQVPAGGVAA